MRGEGDLEDDGMFTHAYYDEDHMAHIFPAVALDRGRLSLKATHHTCGQINPELLDRVAPLPETSREAMRGNDNDVPAEVEEHVRARITEVRRQIYGST
jgi:hypothetical protein